jgi:3-deoxy-manno-octulosonate cytidylyltransferase (CMP-KDO synthetase)
MDILGIIPARYASNRFPGKPLADIGGRSMISRVYQQCDKATSLQQVIVATDDERIADHVASFGGHAVMTSPDHGSGTERCAEAIHLWSRHTGKKWEAVINIQGDEPFISPAQINHLAALLQAPGITIGTLVKKIENPDELLDPNLVKVVLDHSGKALYFSRSPIPYLRGKDEKEWVKHHDYFKHIGIYGYRADVLQKLPGLAPSALENAESLEQLRWLSHGFRINTFITEMESISIDTPADLLKITNIT